MPTPAEIRAELERRKKAAPTPAPAPVSGGVNPETIRAELARRSTPSNGSGIGPVNPMVAEGRAMASAAAQVNPTMSPVRPEARGDVALRKPTLTLPQQRGPLMSPAQREAMAPERAEAERQRRLSQERREAAGALGGGMDMLPVTDAAGNVSPGTEVDRDISKGIVGSSLNFGQGLAEGVANTANVTMAASTGVGNAAMNLINPGREQSQPMRINVPQNAIVDGEGPLASVSGFVPRIAGQIAGPRVSIGKAMPGGGFGAEVAKDAIAMGLGTPQDASRISDSIPSDTPVLGALADVLRTREGDNAFTAFGKNAAEDLLTSTVAGGIVRGGSALLDAVGGAGRTATPRRANLTAQQALPTLSKDEQRAADIIIKRLEADGIYLDDVIRTASAMGRRFDSGVYETLSELGAYTGKSSGANLRSLAMAAGAVPGPAQEAIVRRVGENTAALPSRVNRAATRATGQSADSAVDTLKGLDERLKRESGPLYDDAYAAQLDPAVYQSQIAPMLAEELGQDAAKSALRGLKTKLSGLKIRAASPNETNPQRVAFEVSRMEEAAASLDRLIKGQPGIPTVQALDEIKRAFDDQISTSGRYTSGNIGSAKRNFAEAVSNSTGGKYGQALGNYEDISRLQEAFDFGIGALTKKSWQLKQEMDAGLKGRAWSGGEVEAIALGVARHIEDLIESSDQRALTSLLKGKALENLATSLGSDKAAKMFEQSLRRLSANREWGRRVAGGSDTAMRQASIRDAGNEGEDAVTRALDKAETSGVAPTLQDTAWQALGRPAIRAARDIYQQMRYPGLYDEGVNRVIAPLIGDAMTPGTVKELDRIVGTRLSEKGKRRGAPAKPQRKRTTPTPAAPATGLGGPASSASASPTSTGLGTSAAKPPAKNGVTNMLAGGALGGTIGALGSGEADAQTPETAAKIADNDALIERQLSQVADFESALKIFSDGTPKEIQAQLDSEGFDLGPTGIDGSLGDITKAAIRGRKEELNASLKTARDRLKELEGTRDKLKADAAFEKTRPTDEQQAFRDYAPLLGGIAGATGAKLLRIGGTTVSKFTAKNAIKKADALLNDAPISPPKTVQDRAEIRKRATNVNEFWQRGGSKTKVPFETKRDGTWTARPAKDVTPPSALFPDKFIGRKVGAMDALIGGSAATEAVLAGQNAEVIKEKLADARETAQDDPSEKNLARVQELEDQYAQAKGLMMLGIGAGIGTGIGVLTSKYASKRANVPKAEEELAILREYFANQKKTAAKPSGGKKKPPSSPPLPPSRPRRNQRPPNP
jgi:hypothetical protein